MKQKGFAPLIILILIAVVGVLGYIGYKNTHKAALPLATPTCQMNCPDAMPTPKPGSIAGWVKYENPDGKFSFEYPSSWYYEVGGAGIDGVYSVSKEELEAIKNKYKRTGFEYFWSPINYNERILSDYITTFYLEDSFLKYKISSSKNTLFGKTKIATYEFCNGVSAFMKGANVPPGGYCITKSYIDFGKNGFVEVSLWDGKIPPEFTEQWKIYKEILSTFKFTD